MYVKTTTVRRGKRTYRYLTLVEAVRDGAKVRHEVVARLGEASALAESGELDRIVAALAAHANGEWMDATSAESDGAPALGTVAAVWAYWCRLGLDGHFATAAAHHAAPVGDAIFAMVANRLADPCSKRKVVDWVSADVVMPEGFATPEAHQYYRGLDVVARAKAATEDHLYAALTDLTNLDLRLVCYDLTSTYFEGARTSSDRFASRAFGYSRDHRGDRPQIVIGLLVTGDGIPIAHHVFPGNTNDTSTLPMVLADLKKRFGVGAITVVADRGLISADNVCELTEAGFAHVLATRLHNTRSTKAALVGSTRPDAVWEAAPDAHSAVCDLDVDGTRHIVVASFERWVRDAARTAELVARTSAALGALEERVRAGRLTDKAAIARAATKILDPSGVARLFDLEINEASFVYHYDEVALDYEEQLLAGRWVLTTSLGRHQASAVAVLGAYRRLLEVESSFRVLKDFLELRPVFHWTEDRVRGHVAVCVLAAVIEALMEADLRRGDVRDPDLVDQRLSPRRALQELGRIRAAHIDTGGTTLTLISRRNALQARILDAFGVDTSGWNKRSRGT